MCGALRFLVFAFAVLATAAHAQNSQTQLQSQITTTFPDNNTFSITPAAVRGFLSSFVSSYNQFGTSCATSSLSSYQWFANTSGAPTATKLGIFNPGTNTCLPILDLNQTTGTITLDPALSAATALPNTSIYGSSVIVTGLIPTWPMAAVTGCTVVSGGSGFGSTPTATLLGGITHGGSGGGAISLTISGGAVNGCSVTAGGNYSYPPEVFVTGGGGGGALVTSTLGNTNVVTYSAGTMLVNGASIIVPQSIVTYTISPSSGAYFCDFINTTNGAITTQQAQNGTGNFGCTSAPGGTVLLRTVFVQNGQPGSSRGNMNGVESIQYFMPMVAGLGYFDTNSADAPPSTTELPFGNSTPANFPCMMGSFATKQGNCQWNTQYWLFTDNDVQPIPGSNSLDAGPIFDFQRVNTTRAGVNNDLLFYLVSRGNSANPSPNGSGVVYSSLLSTILSAGTVAHSYADVQGAWQFMTAGPDNSFNGTGGVPRFTLGGGLFASGPVVGASTGDCGQGTVPSGGVNLADEGPSTINLCGNATNQNGNVTGYYVDNKIALQTLSLTLYGSTSGSVKVVCNASTCGGGTVALPGSTSSTYTLLSTGGATLSGAPINPASTTSTVGVMAGIGGTCAITPLYSSRVLAHIEGVLSNNTNGDGSEVQGRWGTGTAPANAAALTGTQFTGSPSFTVAAANQTAPFSISGVITGLTPGTTIWLDTIEQSLTGGTTQLTNIRCTASEI